MVKWFPSLVLILVLTSGTSRATVALLLEGDLRGEYSDRDALEGSVDSVGGSLRKVLADGRGDRLILYLQAEAVDDASDVLLHQAYAEWKGPMGRWNLVLGRVPMPWGLLTAWSPDRLPFLSPYDTTGTFTSDNGLLLRGSAGMYDYGLALTQGYGMGSIQDYPGPGNLTGRLGITPALAEDLSVGISFAAGTIYPSEDGHGHGMGDPVMEEERIALALDCTWYHGQGAYRVEGGGRYVEDRWLGTLFGMVDYALLPKFSLQLAGQIYTHMESHEFGQIYAGASTPVGAFTLRMGYEYEHAQEETHKVVVQLYRLFSFTR